MLMVNIADAKTNLSTYIKAAESGEDVYICRRNKPIVALKIVSDGKGVPESAFGLAKRLFGDAQIEDEAFAPLNEDELKEWTTPL